MKFGDVHPPIARVRTDAKVVKELQTGTAGGMIPKCFLEAVKNWGLRSAPVGLADLAPRHMHWYTIHHRETGVVTTLLMKACDHVGETSFNLQAEFRGLSEFCAVRVPSGVQLTRIMCETTPASVNT